MSEATLAEVAVPAAAGAIAPGRFLRDLLRYGLVSLVALLCDTTILLALTRFGLHYLAAATLGFAVGIALAYALSVRFVFADRRGASPLSELAGFLASGLAGLLLTQALMLAFVGGLSLRVGLAKIPTAGCVFLFNFLVRRALVFGQRTV